MNGRGVNEAVLVRPKAEGNLKQPIRIYGCRVSTRNLANAMGEIGHLMFLQPRVVILGALKLCVVG